MLERTVLVVSLSNAMMGGCLSDEVLYKYNGGVKLYFGMLMLNFESFVVSFWGISAIGAIGLRGIIDYICGDITYLT